MEGLISLSRYTWFMAACGNKGLVLTGVGRYRAATDCFDKAPDIEPDDAVALSDNGSLLVPAKEFGDATTRCDEAFRTVPIQGAYSSPRTDIRIGEGLALAHMGEYGAAVENFDAALDVGQMPDARLKTGGPGVETTRSVVPYHDLVLRKCHGCAHARHRRVWSS